MYVQRNNEARSCNHCCRGKAISIAYSECVFVALIIQHAMRMLDNAPAVQYFSTLSHKRHIYEKERLLKVKCVFQFFLQLLSEICLILRRNDRYVIKNVYYSVRF
jgi:hypothetical protein